MTSIQKIFSLLFCSVALYGFSEQPNSITKFIDALTMYKQDQTPEKAKALVAEYDNPENGGKNRTLLKQHLTQAGFTINKLRIQAKESSSQAAATSESESAPMATKAVKAPKAIEAGEFTSEEQEIKKNMAILEKIIAELAQLEQTMSEKRNVISAEESIIADAALMINVNSINGQKNDLQPLLDQTKKIMELQKELHAQEKAVAEKMQQKINHATLIKQKQHNLAKNRAQEAVRKAQQYHAQIKDITQSCRGN